MTFPRGLILVCALLSNIPQGMALELVMNHVAAWEGESAQFEIAQPKAGAIYEWFYKNRSVQKGTNHIYRIERLQVYQSGSYTVTEISADEPALEAEGLLRVYSMFLQNPDFNDNADQALDNRWVMTDGSAYEFHGVEDILPQASPYFLVVSGAEPTNYVYQQVPIRPGVELFGSVYGMISAEAAAAGSEAWAQLTFRSSQGEPITQYRSGLLNTASPKLAWVLLRLTHMVDPVTGTTLKTVDSFPTPELATSYTFEIVHRSNASGLPVRFDTAHVGIAPELRVGLVGVAGYPYVTVQTIPGASYRIYSADSLAPLAWRKFLTFTATETGHQFGALKLGESPSRRFFRVEKISPVE